MQPDLRGYRQDNMALKNLKSKLNKLSTTDYFTDKHATGFTKDFNPGTDSKFKPHKINEFVDIPTVNFFDLNQRVNKGFVPKIELNKTQYKNVSPKQDKFSWPAILKRIDYEGNNLSPISDFDRQFSTSIGQMASQLVYTESQLRKKFLFSKDKEAIKFGYKNKYEFRRNADIRIDSNSNTHPIILKSLLNIEENRYGAATDRFGNIGHTIDFIRGGAKTHLDRVTTDVKRLYKFISSPDGIRFTKKQFLLQLFSPRAESTIYNPLSLAAGGIRVVKMKRFTSVKLITDAFDFVRGIPKDGLGLYEKYEGYGSWNMEGNRGKGDGFIHKGNKLWQYSQLMLELPLETKTFSLTDLANDPGGFAKKAIGAWAKKKYNKAKKKVLSKASKFLSGLAGRKVQLGDIDLPTQYVHSQEHQQRTPVYKSIIETKNDYKTLAYQNLGKKHHYYGTAIIPAGALQDLYDGTPSDRKEIASVSIKKPSVAHTNAYKIRSMGDASSPTEFLKTKNLGLVKKGWHHYDKVNRLPYGDATTTKQEKNLDLVKFQFKDVVNNKFIVFRATVTGISDSITPEWSSERYIGRADQVHVYKGAERSVSFSFIIAPISKPELIILWEKLNYLTGLTFPDYDEGKMVAPWIEFTFGHMYTAVPGFIESLSYSIPDNAPYETDEFQLPKVIEASMTFKYVGNKLQTRQGKHFDLPWMLHNPQNTSYSSKDDKIVTAKASFAKDLDDLNIGGHV